MKSLLISERRNEGGKRQITYTKVTRSRLLIAEFSGFTHDKLSLLISSRLPVFASFSFDQLEATIFLNYFLFSSLRRLRLTALLSSIPSLCLIVNITWDYYQMPQIFIGNIFFYEPETSAVESLMLSAKQRATWIIAFGITEMFHW